MFAVRRAYYRLVERLAEIELTRIFTVSACTTAWSIEALRKMDDPYPYWRGMIAEIGFHPVKIEYTPEAPRARHHQEQLLHALRHGHAGHHQPLEGAAAAGHHARFRLAGGSLLVALGYLVYKLLFWNNFSVGMAPLVVGLFFFSARAVVLHRHPRRVHRRHPHPGPSPAAGGGEGTHQFR